jgi:hypothetical protein
LANRLCTFDVLPMTVISDSKRKVVQRLLLQPAHEAVNPFQSLLNVRHAGRVADAEVVVRAIREISLTSDSFFRSW